MIIKPLLLSALETALNRYLSMDDNAPLFLKPLAGKVIAIQVQPFNLVFFLCPTEKNIQLLESYSDQPDTTLSGSATALGLMGLSSTPMNALFSGRVTIEGDTETGQQFQQLFDKLDIDLEEQVSHFTGNTIAHKLGQIAKAGQHWTEESIETLRLNLSEFLQEETRDLPSQPEIDIFYRQVDTVRADFDRLQARVERLLNKENA